MSSEPEVQVRLAGSATVASPPGGHVVITVTLRRFLS
jgi:hypothetical protein